MDEQNEMLSKKEDEQAPEQNQPASEAPVQEKPESKPNTSQDESVPKPAPAAATEPEAAPSSYTDGQTNWVKLIALYALIGLVVYAIIWYFFLRSSGPY